MEWWEAVLLGIIQGLTEFIPVSSSGHIELLKVLLGLQADSDLTFSIVLHAGTVGSTLVVFWQEIWELLKGLIRLDKKDWQFATCILISMIPTGIIGIGFKDYVDELFKGNLLLVGACLIVSGLALMFAHYTAQGDKKLDYKIAGVMGLAQAVAILPGLSRSGSTIALAVLMKADRARIARFSFLMVLPVIIGASLLECLKIAQNQTAAQVDWVNWGIGLSVSFIVGLLACKFMVKVVSHGKYIGFAAYCWGVGSLALLIGLYHHFIDRIV